MAKETTLEMFQGTDRVFRYEVLDEAEITAQDAFGWQLSWMLKKRKSDADADAAVTKISSNGITMNGVYNPAPLINTLRVHLDVQDTDTDSLPSGAYYHELKRTNDGAEAILSYGRFTLKQAVHKA